MNLSITETYQLLARWTSFRSWNTGDKLDRNLSLCFFTSVINQHNAQNFCFTISLFHASTCFEHVCSSSGSQNCITLQFWPPDDEHMCSKHVEAWNKFIVKQKICASSWLITEINILRCTVNKTSKFIIMRQVKLTIATLLTAWENQTSAFCSENNYQFQEIH